MNLDDLELELRKLPGVQSIGFSERDDMLFVQVHMGDPDASADPGLSLRASRIAARHSDRPVAVEVVRWRTPANRRVGVPAAGIDAGTEAPSGRAADRRAIALDFERWGSSLSSTAPDEPPELGEPVRARARSTPEILALVLSRAALVLFVLFLIAAYGAIRYVRSEFGADADVFRYAAAVAEIGSYLVAAVAAWVGSVVIRGVRAARVEGPPVGEPVHERSFF